MEITNITENQVVTEQSKDATDIYKSLLGLDHFPRSPEETPDEIILPNNAIGYFENSILETTADGLERSQLVAFDPKKGFISQKVYIGKKTDVGIISTADKCIRAYFGKKPLVFYHTHPPGKLNYFFSDEDLGTLALQRTSFINMVGASDGAVALFQTEKATKLPFYAVGNAVWIRSKLKEIRQTHHKKWTDANSREEMNEAATQYQHQLISFLGDMGYSLYSWFPRQDTIMPGDLSTGLKLTKMSKDADLLQKIPF